MKHALFLSLIFVSSAALAQQTWVGFKPALEVQVKPSEIINNTVVMIRAVGGTSNEYKDAYEMLDVDSVPQVKNQKKLAYKFDMNDPLKNMRAIQIETCRNQGLKKCPVYNVSATSTGFFDQGRYLNMCRHSFHNWLVLASKANNRALDTLSPPMIIFSKDKKVLYNSALVPQDQLIKVSYLNLDDRLNNELYGGHDKNNKLSVNFSMSDYIQFESVSEIVPAYNIPFVTDFSELKKGVRIYQAGYPAATNYFSSQDGDAPGYELVVSSGSILATSSKQQAIKANTIAGPGMSGGPMLLEDGRAAGLVCNVNIPKVDQPEAAATTSIVIDRDVLESFWQSLSY